MAFEARAKAEHGVVAYKAFWSGLTKEQQKALLPQHENLKSAALAADAEAARLALEAEETATEGDLDTPFAGAAIPDGIEAPTTH